MRDGGTFPGSSVRDSSRDEAISWFVAFCEDDVTPALCKSFDVWLKASPENVRAYLQVSAFWEAAGSLNQHRKLEVEELLRRASAENNVLSMGDPPASEPARAGTVRRGQFSVRIAAAAVMLLVVGVVLAIWWQVRDPVYATQVGEERTITLSDGSIVELNARSRLRIEYRQRVRRVTLLDGQALFRVAKNTMRPFIVVSGTTQVRAVGTEFDVYRQAAGTLVTVVEGQVAVTDAALGSAPSLHGAVAPTSSLSIGEDEPPRVLLAAGEQLRVSAQAISAPVRTNPVIATAWSQGKLIFDSTPLSEVVAEVNRYNPRPLAIDDPKILTMHVSGTFSTTDSAQIIQFVAERFGLVIHESADGIRLSAR
jgi:transmembrane sensor